MTSQLNKVSCEKKVNHRVKHKLQKTKLFVLVYAQVLCILYVFILFVKVHGVSYLGHNFYPNL